MSDQQTHGSHEVFAGTTPAAAAGGPATPLPLPPPDRPVLSALPESPVPAAPASPAGIEASAGEGTAGVAGDEVPELPIDPRPFGAQPARLCGRGPRPARRLVLPQEAA